MKEKRIKTTDGINVTTVIYAKGKIIYIIIFCHVKPISSSFPHDSPVNHVCQIPSNHRTVSHPLQGPRYTPPVQNLQFYLHAPSVGVFTHKPLFYLISLSLFNFSKYL